MCGDANRFCKIGSSKPTDVKLGYYSIGGNESTRSDEVMAPRGSYAINGLLYKCRKSYFGSQEGLSSPYCTSPCQVPGYFCPGILFNRYF